MYNSRFLEAIKQLNASITSHYIRITKKGILILQTMQEREIMVPGERTYELSRSLVFKQVRII